MEIENGITINTVSLGLVEDAYEKYKDYFSGYLSISINQAVSGYVRSVKGKGQIIRIYNYKIKSK
ncbi:hypothetical protein [Marixanthomonas sp. SCSIO 43207]|uniref:hypothetical protein n=1 Tax=Marixanthomonas sp. SCSIO 43207 TaxID=2779360 RepID=UPI00351CB7C1